MSLTSHATLARNAISIGLNLHGIETRRHRSRRVINYARPSLHDYLATTNLFPNDKEARRQIRKILFDTIDKLAERDLADSKASVNDYWQIECVLNRWTTGEYVTHPFAATRYLAVYERHLDSMAEFEKNDPGCVTEVCSDLWKNVCEQAGIDGPIIVADAQDNTSYVDQEDIERMRARRAARLAQDAGSPHVDLVQSEQV